MKYIFSGVFEKFLPPSAQAIEKKFNSPSSLKRREFFKPLCILRLLYFVHFYIKFTSKLRAIMRLGQFKPRNLVSHAIFHNSPLILDFVMAGHPFSRLPPERLQPSTIESPPPSSFNTRSFTDSTTAIIIRKKFSLLQFLKYIFKSLRFGLKNAAGDLI